MTTIVNALLNRARGLLADPDLNAQLAAHGIRSLAARFEELTAAIPELEARYAELVGETGRLAELAAERRQQLADLDDADLCEQRDDELSAALEEDEAPEPALYNLIGGITLTEGPMDPAAAPAAFAGDVPRPRRLGALDLP